MDSTTQIHVSGSPEVDGDGAGLPSLVDTKLSSPEVNALFSEQLSEEELVQ